MAPAYRSGTTESMMASQTRGDDVSPGDSRESKEHDPTLDFFSDKFDPLKALSAPGLAPPVKNARTHDNLARFESAQKPKPAGSKTKQKQDAAAPVIPERSWLPHQLPVQREHHRAKQNVLTRMENAEGPFRLLKKCKDERLRIKVWTRNDRRVRGYCEGYVTAFDKHWNMSLEEVTEVWTRLKRVKVPASGGMPAEAPSGRNTIVPPKITVIKTDRKTETCQRYIDQILVRGEQVVIVVVNQ